MRTNLMTLGLLLILSGCGTVGDRNSAGIAAPGATPPSADSAAILAMEGEYRVTFAFDETVSLAAGYDKRPPKRSGAAELVLVVEESPRRIVLQHLLLAGNGVIKHWRQDWVWEADSRLEFVADQTWRKVHLPREQTAGRWTQCVYEVSDAPRYCGTGRWNHRYGHPTWTSDRGWRPLPRREYTTRDDYNSLNVENRHTITPTGWTHEQDNSKTLRAGERTERVLVREFGFNDYRRAEDIDFSPAYAYWKRTGDYWARVRDVWASYFDAGGVFLATDVDGMPIIEGLFALAEQHGADQGRVAAPEIDAVFRAHVRSIDTLPNPQLSRR